MEIENEITENNITNKRKMNFVKTIENGVTLDDREGDFLVPPGKIAFFARLTPPPGWLECNGQTFDPNIYHNLANAIGNTWGTNKVPDFRSYFLRCHDNRSDSSAYDQNRIFGSKQNDGNITHKHVTQNLDNHQHTHNNNDLGEHDNHVVTVNKKWVSGVSSSISTDDTGDGFIMGHNYIGKTPVPLAELHKVPAVWNASNQNQKVNANHANLKPGTRNEIMETVTVSIPTYFLGIRTGTIFIPEVRGTGRYNYGLWNWNEAIEAYYNTPTQAAPERWYYTQSGYIEFNTKRTGWNRDTGPSGTPGYTVVDINNSGTYASISENEAMDYQTWSKPSKLGTENIVIAGGEHIHNIEFSISTSMKIDTGNSGGNESRPKNVSLLTCIKY